MFSAEQIIEAAAPMTRADTALSMAVGAYIAGDIDAAQVLVRAAVAELHKAADTLGMELIECDTENYR